MNEENTKPKLDAATLPIGTVMELGGSTYQLDENDGDMIVFASRDNDLRFWYSEVKELIDRGVELRLPEGGAK